MFGSRRAWLEWALMGQGLGFIQKSRDSYAAHWSVGWPELVAMMGVRQPPEYHPEGDVWTHSLMATDAAIRSNMPFYLRVTALLHDIGKPRTFTEEPGDRIRFNGHDGVGADMADELLAWWGFGPWDRERIVTLIRNHMVWTNLRDMKTKSRRKLYGRPWFDDLLALHRIDVEASSRDFRIAEYAIYDRAGIKMNDELAEANRPAPVERLVTGKDVLEAGYPEGPAVGFVLKAVEDAQRAGTVRDRQEALGLIAQLQNGC